ncbi:hypothetical protein [Photorhabdus temperata]|uniref:hypothetical protein n=1 Tax=Photorhabdus temperata TaxID=574560 RepID=UPI000A5E614E|nr:hypothetical protein [Photorhabdus temperata]
MTKTLLSQGAIFGTFHAIQQIPAGCHWRGRIKSKGRALCRVAVIDCIRYFGLVFIFSR